MAKKMGFPTIEEVARQARTSTATVSHVINNTRYVSDEVRLRVNEAIEELGYRPSAVARGLARRKTQLVSVVLPDVDNPLFRDVFRAMEASLFESEYDLLVANTWEDLARQEAILDALISRRVDGIIIAPARGVSDLLETVRRYRTPMVIIDRYAEGYDLPALTVNNEQAAFEAVSHLFDDGHSRIGFIGGFATGDETVSAVADRLHGYLRAHEEHGLAVDPNLVCTDLTNNRQEDGYQAALDTLSHPRRPSAILVINSLLQLGALRAFRELNLHCPEDVGLVGFDDDDWATISKPPMTVVRQPTLELGRRAAAALVRLLEEGDTVEVAENQELKCKLIIRGSCSTKCLKEFEGETTST